MILSDFKVPFIIMVVVKMEASFPYLLASFLP